MSADYSSPDYSGLVQASQSAQPVSGGKGLLKKKLDKSKQDKKAIGQTTHDVATSSSNDTGDSYKRGGKVKRTGLAKVHRGERVLTAKQAKRYRKTRSK